MFLILEIINQINQKEVARRSTKDFNRIEYNAARQKEEERSKNIKSIINRKINAMRQANIPEKFIKDVERQLYVSSGKISKN